jgi:hypothetical protein
MIKSMRMRATGHVASSLEKRKAYRILVGKPDQQKDLDVGGIIILKWILAKQGGVIWTRSLWLRIWTSGGLL